MPPKKTSIAAGAEGVPENGGANGTTGNPGSSQSGGGMQVNGKTPSENDVRFFFALIENLTAKPDANWQEVADILGLKDVKCTKERWRQITKKFELEYPEAASPKAPRGKKAAAATSADGAEGEAIPATPKPKTPRVKGKATATPKSAETAVSDDELAAEGSTPGGEPVTAHDVPVTPTTPAKGSARGRKPGSSTKKRASSEGEADGDHEEGSPAKKKPATRKPRGPNKKTLAAQAQAAAQAAATAAEDPEVNKAADELKTLDTSEAGEASSSSATAPVDVDTEMTEANDVTKEGDVIVAAGDSN